MKKLLSIHRGKNFFGKSCFTNPEIFNRHGIKPVTASVDEYSLEELEEVTTKHPPEDIDGVLIHQNKLLFELMDIGLYSDIPLLVAGHVIKPHKNRQDWEESLAPEREVYLFTGSIRSARSFFLPGQENFQVVIAPIMGRSEATDISEDFFIETPEKKYDIGWFSHICPKKRPHRALETANNVAEELGTTLRVFIAGILDDSEYVDMISELTESDHYNWLEIDFKGFMSYRRLFEAVQETRVMYLPLMKPTETTCYAAWETISYDIPLVGSDWAGIGEAIRNSRQPNSEPIPVKKVDSAVDVFPPELRNKYPDVVEQVCENSLRNPRYTINEKKAQQALIDALQSESIHPREFQIPEQVQSESTISAMDDILSGDLSPNADVPDTLISSKTRDRIKMERGYSLLRDPYEFNALMYQTSESLPPTE